MGEQLSIAFRPMGNPTHLTRLAKRAEAAHFRRIWLVEVYEADILVLASALAQCTNRIGIAAGVVNSSLRMPFLLAMAAATASDLSKGRFALGVGAGTPPMRFEFSPRLDKPVARLRETLELLGPLLKGESVNFRGRIYRAEGLRLGIPPLRRVELYAAAMGPKTVEIAARHADGVLLMLTTRRFVRDAKAIILQTLKKRGDPPSRFPIACHLVTCLSKNREEAEAVARSTLAYFITVEVYRESIKRLGFAQEVEELKVIIQSRGQKQAAEKVPREMLDELIVYGTASECREKIARYVDDGVDEPVVYPSNRGLPFPKDIERVISLMRPGY